MLARVPLFLSRFSFFTFAAPASAQFQMPDPKQMSGIPRPVTDLPTGHVSVRLIRGQLSNNIQGHPVEMHAGGKVLTVKTDENGRAEFSGVAPGTTVKAVATVDGERLESQEFPWPGDGGIRLMLVATPKGGDAPPPVFQPQPGNVVLGDETRVIIDHADDALQVYYILDIQNTARAPVNPPSAVVVNMPVRRAQRHGARRCAAGRRARRSRDHHRTLCVRPDRRADCVSDAGFERRCDVRADASAGRSRSRSADEESRRHFADVAAASECSGARVRRGAIHPCAGAGDTGRRVACDDGLGAAAPQPLAAADCADAGDRDARRRFLGGGAPAIAHGQRRARRSSSTANARRSSASSSGSNSSAGRAASTRQSMPNGAPRSSRSSNASTAIWTPRGDRAPSRERRLSRSLHPRAQPELRAPPGVDARVARLPQRRNRRPARTEWRGQIDAARDHLDAGGPLVG